MRTFRHTVKVEGNFSFPIDMLRYDRCSPATERDSSEIARTHNAYSSGKKSITVVCDAPKIWKPTAGRWESFGWKVVEHVVQLP